MISNPEGARHYTTGTHSPEGVAKSLACNRCEKTEMYLQVGALAVSDSVCCARGSTAVIHAAI
jgi:hypothetical protein